MGEDLRIAFFPDTYDEIDGVANTSRQFAAFARRRGHSLLIVCGGASDKIETDGSVVRMTCARGRIGFPVDEKHDFDLLFWRYYSQVADELRRFAPDVVHVTGPSDVGQLGALLARRMQIPLAASWHTNLHQYAEQRASAVLYFVPENLRKQMGGVIRECSLSASLGFYKFARVLFAPNPELMELLAKGTGKAVHPMRRGIDVALFTPERRDRRGREFIIGYVGRLTVEKNVRLLAEIEQMLVQRGVSNFRILIVGQGAEEPWLKANLWRTDFAGVLKGKALARAYANMDAFVFPSRTDTFGNVVLEALASGVPAIVANEGGPQFTVRHGETGFIARNTSEFVSSLRLLVENPATLQRMREAARLYACSTSWDSIFEGLYAVYKSVLRDSSAEAEKIRVARSRELAAPWLG